SAIRVRPLQVLQGQTDKAFEFGRYTLVTQVHLAPAQWPIAAQFFSATYPKVNVWMALVC
uniref:Uncharacterized protein n=1 Tax=Romanomermis culicivorax TaxID=13658 RepID=A0A915L667_ROMCU